MQKLIGRENRPILLEQQERACYIVHMELDRSKLSIVGLHESSDVAYWAQRSPLERLRAVEVDRQVAYGKSSTSRRLQRVLEVVERV